jgi:hypothetical protein
VEGSASVPISGDTEYTLPSLELEKSSRNSPGRVWLDNCSPKFGAYSYAVYAATERSANDR